MKECINKLETKTLVWTIFLLFRYSDNQRPQDAINLMLFHWGVHAWVVYSLVAILMEFVAYRRGLPMTISSCFHPLIGNRIFGWIGEMINILSIIVTMFGVCTSLGLWVITINSGINRINRDIEENSTNQIIIIWAITAIATISVIKGLKDGIRRRSLFLYGHDAHDVRLVLW